MYSKLFCVFVLLGCVLYVQGRHHILTTSDRYAVVGSNFTFTSRGDSTRIPTWYVSNTESWVSLLGGPGECDYYRKPEKKDSFNCSVQRNTLTIKSVSLSEHGTVWRCGDYVPRSNEIKLEVRDGPGTSLKLNISSVVTAVEGSNVTVSCSAMCFIKCNYQWKIGDDVISNTGILSLADINRSQSGLYVCTAENPDTKQTVNKTLHLFVHHGPGSSLRVNSSSDITVEEGSDVTITCIADCFIKCLFRWELTKQIVSNNGLLALTNMTRFEDGVYTCIAVNPDTNQTANTKIIINIKYGPDSSLGVNSSSDITVEEGSEVTVTCKADCFFKCFYRWELTNQIVSNNGLMALTNITRFQDGVYTCTAVNPDTNQTAHTKISIKVRYGPDRYLRVIPSSDITVKEGSDVTVSCKADCSINCLYRWELTNQTVSNNGLLALSNITRFEGGVYTCIAVNPDTNQTANTKIIIDVESAVKVSSRLGTGIGIGFGTCFALFVIIIGVVLFFRYTKDNQTPLACYHQDSRNSFSSLEERGYEVPYDVIQSLIVNEMI